MTKIDIYSGNDDHTIAMMATDRLTPEQKQTFSRKPYGYGLGVQCPPKEGAGRITRFGWGGAAGAFASVDPVNNITIYYAQHVLSAPNRPLRVWLYHTVRADILGETIQIPNIEEDYEPSITY